MPKVSVCLVTYNQEKYIAQAVGSVMMQEADFDYELVVGEDCSTDRTREICRNLAQKFAGKMRLLENSSNLGPGRNFINTLGNCTGEYVALLEGDDFWTDPRKLMKQTEFLDHHPDYSICFHNVTSVDDDGIQKPRAEKFYFKPDSSIEDLMRGNFIPTPSCVFRRRHDFALPDWYLSLSVGDWPLHVLNAEHGKIRYLDETMAAYRLHPSSIWTGRDPVYRLRQFTEAAQRLDEHFDRKYHKILGPRIAGWLREIADGEMRAGDRDAAASHAKEAARVVSTLGLAGRVNFLVRYRYPHLYEQLVSLKVRLLH